jgi:hypothetical protein
MAVQTAYETTPHATLGGSVSPSETITQTAAH